MMNRTYNTPQEKHRVRTDQSAWFCWSCGKAAVNLHQVKQIDSYIWFGCGQCPSGIAWVNSCASTPLSYKPKELTIEVVVKQ